MSEDGTEVERLRRSVGALREQLSGAFQRSPAAKLHIDPQTADIVDANPAAAAFYGWSVEELRAMRITDINQLPRELIEAEMARAESERRSYFEFRHRLRSGEVRDVQVYSGPVQLDGRAVLESVICDISERTRLAEALAHSQRLDALSRLAGSVAHDFNNLLATMEMSLGLVRRRTRRGEPIEDELGELAAIVGTGTGLTQQLLAFCRRQHLKPEVLDLGEVVRQLRALLARSIGESIDLVLEPAAAPVPVLVDRVQLEQVVLNLTLNARDAMADGGTLTIGVDVVGASSARLTVTDDGPGIPPSVAPYVFEPFFTTRREQGGSGLGLATVFGIVSQSGGAVTFENRPSGGARFVVLLPLAMGADLAAPGGAARVHDARGGDETILLAEDEPRIRELVATALREHGYRVLTAGDGVAGLTAARAHDGPIHLLLTDVMMPRSDGRELAVALVCARPDVKVLFMSGYAGQPGLDQILLDAGESFLAKPFSFEGLLVKVREVLDRAPRRSSRAPRPPG